MTGIESTALLLHGGVKSRCHTSGTSTKEMYILESVDKRQKDIVQEPPKHPSTLSNDTSRDQTSMLLQESQVITLSALTDQRDESGNE